MKIRTGFVSNSSSSSFLIYGVYQPEIPEDVMEFAQREDIKEAWAKWYQEKLQTDFAKENPEYYPQDITYEQWIKDNCYEDEEEDFVFGEIFGLMGIAHYDPFYDGDHYFGICPQDMPDDETMGEFKSRVTELLKKLFGNNIECGWHEYAWRDG